MYEELQRLRERMDILGKLVEAFVAHVQHEMEVHTLELDTLRDCLKARVGEVSDRVGRIERALSEEDTTELDLDEKEE